jgi:carbamoyl-phosphate synthase large subunit
VSRVDVVLCSVGRRVELVRWFRRAYQELGLDGEVVGLDMDPLAPALAECDAATLVPRLDAPDFVAALTDVVTGRERPLVFPLIDPDVPVLAGHRDELDAAGARVQVVPPAGAGVVGDKQATTELFERIDVPVPGWSAGDGRGLGFPVVVKPRFGSAGADVHFAADEEELSFWRARVPDPLVQERLPGPEITVDVLCLEDGLAAAACCRERIEVRSGEVAKARTVSRPDVAAHCARIARELRARGPITVQCILDSAGAPRFTEVNARFGGGAPLGFAAGMESPRWVLAHAAGRDVELPPFGQHRGDLYMTRYDESRFMDGGELDASRPA